MNRLEALKIFVTVAETLHFRETASRLAVSPQVVTRMISELEQELGEVLFQRSTRQVKLTDFGQQFLPKAQLLLMDVENLFETTTTPIQQQEIMGIVRIAVPQMALMQRVLKELLQALAPYPNLRIDWRSDLELLDIIDAKIDVGIRFGTPEDSRLIVKKVGTAEDCIVVSPTLLAKIGVPKDWQDLQRNYPLSALLNPNTGRAWTWYLSSHYQLTPNQPKFMGNNMDDELVTVLQGQTIACLPRLMCRDYLKNGELIELFAQLERKQWSAYVYRPQRTITHPRVKLVFDTLATILNHTLYNLRKIPMQPQYPYPIRPETPDDYSQIHDVIKNAFANAEHSDHQEQFLVERLRKDSAFLPDLALVAENEKNEIIGHIVFSEAVIDGKKVLALAPLSVRPDYQHQGIGTALINHAHAMIKRLDYPAVVVLGHPDYYAKFGYDNASEFGITAPFDVPDGVLRVWQIDKGEKVPSGEIEYAKAFFG